MKQKSLDYSERSNIPSDQTPSSTARGSKAEFKASADRASDRSPRCMASTRYFFAPYGRVRPVPLVRHQPGLHLYMSKSPTLNLHTAYESKESTVDAMAMLASMFSGFIEKKPLSIEMGSYIAIEMAC